MVDQVLAKILEQSFSIHELRQRIRVLKSYLAKKFYGSDNQSLDNETAGQINWLYSLGDQFYQQFNPMNFSQIFEQIESKIESLPTLIIYFAFELTPEQSQEVGNYLRKRYGPYFVFDSKHDPSLIAGCALVWKGVYKDYSLRAKIAENHDAILEVIKQTISATHRIN